MYERLLASGVSFTRVRLIELDEYLGIPLGDERNLYNWLHRVFVGPAGVPAAQVTRFRSDCDDPQQEVRRVEAILEAAGSLDLVVLGLGPNGHIGFNEPGSALHQRVQAITLDEASIESSAAYWGGREYVPRQGITLGFGALREAKRILMLVSGARKADILHEVLYGPIIPEVPASLLRELPQVTVIADRAALRVG
jgi:glucosamine-6-phosphate deaminase